MLLNIYLLCLAIGVIYTLVTTFINGLVSAVDLHAHIDGHVDGHMDSHVDSHMDGHVDSHIDGHVDGHVDGHADGHAEMHMAGPHVDFALPLRPFTIMILITVFGGMGTILTLALNKPVYLLNNVLLGFVTLPLSIIIAYIVAKVLYQTVYMTLVRAQTTTTRSESDAIGLPAEVVVAITPRMKGKVSYIVNETILSAPAKPYYPGGNGYKQGERVLIKDIQDHVCLVATLTEAGVAARPDNRN